MNKKQWGKEFIEHPPDDILTCSIDELIAWVRSINYGNDSMILKRITDLLDDLLDIVRRFQIMANATSKGESYDILIYEYINKFLNEINKLALMTEHGT